MKRRVLRLGDVERDVDEELSYHRERTIAELEAGGLTRAEAEREAERRFGDEGRWRGELARLGRRSRARRTVAEGLGTGLDVLVSAFRGLVRSPGLSAGIVLTFALGVGANAVMFGVVDRLLLRPPAEVASPEGVRRVLVERVTVGAFSTMGVDAPRERSASEIMAYPDVADLEGLPGLAGVAAYSNRNLVMGRGASAVEANGVLATGGYFSVLGVRPELGRFFGPGEDRVGGERVAVISHGLWQRRYGGDPGVLGALLDLDLPGGPVEVIGVAPREFSGVDLRRTDLWLPLLAAHPSAETFTGTRNWYMLRAFARLEPGVAAEAAASRATLAHRQGRSELVEAGRYDGGAEVVLAPLLAARGPLATDDSVVAKWLAGVSLLVLLIACANVANLLLARTTRRSRETAIRLALGISRRRLASEMVVEGVALALAGGAAALLVSVWGGSLVHGLLMPDVAWAEGLDARVVAFTLVLAAAAGLAATALPVAQASRERVGAALRAGGRGSVGGRASRLRSGLSALQAALSVILLVGAGLFVRSLDRISAVDLGFEPAGLLMVEPVGDGLTGQARGPVLDLVKERLAGLGPVASAAATAGSTPFWSEIVTELRLPGRDSSLALPTGIPSVHAVDADYFRTMDLEILAGRGIQPGDVAGAAPVVVVNATMADAVWPDAAAIGQCIHIDGGPCTEVVGVVEDAVLGRVPEPAQSQYYVPLAQGLVDTTPTVVMARVDPAGSMAATVAAIRSAAVEVDPRMRHAAVTPVVELVAPYTRAWTLGASLFSAFGILALVVAGIGLYSVLAYEVAQRRAEIGIRAALGADRSRIVGAVVGRATRVAALGVGAGLVVAVALGPRIRDLLYETSPRDPVTLAGVVVLLLVVSLAAATVPAVRASRVDPNEALRTD